jgi:ATP-dependent helicase/nuclease subunit B
MGQEKALAPKEAWLGWARHRDHIATFNKVGKPEPRPPVEARPRKLSVSRVEAWIGNPYAIFAREILGLEPLDALGLPPPPSLRGSMIHEALSRFAKAFPSELPSDPKAELLRFAESVLAEYSAHPRVAAFWIPRFERFAAWFAGSEQARRGGIERVVAETSGSLTFAAPHGPFTLTARADRIDVGEGGLVITDYKTGAIPPNKQVTGGQAPQLPLEAAIALALEDKAGFAEVAARPVTALRYIRASGAEPPGEEQDVKTDDIAALAREQLDGLKRLVARFDDPATPYAPARRSRFSYDYDSYAHLARVAEWSAQWGEGEEV